MDQYSSMLNYVPCKPPCLLRLCTVQLMNGKQIPDAGEAGS